MDPEEVALRKEEYYETLADCEPLQKILNQKGGLLLARVGSYPPWPARYSEPGEYAKMARYRTKKGQVCVYFFGTRNYGWVPKTGIQPFTDDVSILKASKKYNTHLIQAALDEAKIILDVTDAAGLRFYDRLIERRNDTVDLPCELCNRVDDHYSLLILCDGKDCKREFHMNCLTPPLDVVPPGDWYCPDCAKNPLKRVQGQTAEELATTGDDSSASVDSFSRFSSKSTGVVNVSKKMKKEKLKTRDGSLKRRLPSVSPEANRNGTPSPAAKKSRFQGSSSVENSPARESVHSLESTPPKDMNSKFLNTSLGAKKPPNIEIPSNGHSVNQSDSVIVDEERDSEERCLICGYGGELIVCEFLGCTKVYHQFCMGGFPFPEDEDATWICPRHTCALTGAKESTEDAHKLLTKGKWASPRKPVTKNLLWKCAKCPVALGDDVFPPLPQSQILSKKARTFVCPYCVAKAPYKVQLGRLLEKLWSTMATNRQGRPFCGPLLCGIEPVDGGDKDSNRLDLFKVLAKIRRLEYDSSLRFVKDIDTVVVDALDLIANRSQPLVEAANTLKIIRDEQLNIHHQKLQLIDNKIRRFKIENRSKKGLTVARVGDKKWPLQWRQECGSLEDKFLARLEANSLDEWTAYVASAALFASCDEVESLTDSDQNNFRNIEDSGVASFASDENRSSSVPTADTGELVRMTSTPVIYSGLTLAEGTDVITALGDLARGEWKKQIGGEQDNHFDDVDGRELFLSPSISEMQHMFDQQSNLLRRALESHCALQKSWLLSKQKLLGLGEGTGFSVGEGRLAAELRLANKNLRQRLRNKDKLVDQLTADHMALRSQLVNLQKELAESKMHTQELEKQIKQGRNCCDNNGASENITDVLSMNGDPVFTVGKPSQNLSPNSTNRERGSNNPPSEKTDKQTSHSNA